MTFLFSVSVILDEQKHDYKIYKLKLVTSIYKAKLISSTVEKPIKEITFWKGKGGWETSLRSKYAKRLAETLGEHIEGLKNE